MDEHGLIKARQRQRKFRRAALLLRLGGHVTARAVIPRCGYPLR